MSEQITIPGCEPRTVPVDAAGRERARLDLAWRREQRRRRRKFEHEVAQACWRQRAEEASRRRAMTQAQRDAEDREREDERVAYEAAMGGVP